MSAVALSAQRVGVTIQGKPIVEGASIELELGKLVAIVGPNGAGKSTLVRAVAGIQPMSAGSVEWSGRAVGDFKGRELGLVRAFVPQRALVPPGLTVREAVTIGRSVHVKPWQRLGPDGRAAVDRAIERAGVERFADRMLTTLSGGEM